MAGRAGSSRGGAAGGRGGGGGHERIDFLAKSHELKTNCAFSVKIMENFKIRSDHLLGGAPTEMTLCCDKNFDDIQERFVNVDVKDIVFRLTFRIEIKADEKGIEDYEGEILRLKQRKEFLKKRIVQNQDWAAHYDKEFGPFVAKYDEFMKQMDILYKNAKVKHADGLKLLMEHFDYHPEFKRCDDVDFDSARLIPRCRWSDTFSAVPFKPM
eukprot:614767-Hanusia_phi.AAC.1